MLEWCARTGYTEPYYVTGVGWYAFPPGALMAIPIQPKGYLPHEAISAN